MASKYEEQKALETQKHNRKAIWLIILSPIIMIASIWILAWMYFILPEWTQFPTIITGLLMFIFCVGLALYGLNELEPN